MDALISVCAWCEADKPEADRATGDNITHGCCDRHRFNLLVIEPLRRVATRLRTVDWYLGLDARLEIARDIDVVIRRLEKGATGEQG